ncbi:protein LAX PANICLE 2-like [Lolium rigidum]|uniref:protein LAX PANICLE 2-like n=1 Tax=Lolium rigidum TaxID=89674 RepID=UPI001F5D35BE|nr:protein LAX PANICLE 2-like [Lolium rigidum]
MVPTTRSLPPHHDSSGKNSKPLSYYDPGYYIAAQLEAAQGADIKQQPSRFPRRLAMADEDNAEAAGTSSRGGGSGDDEDAGGDKDWLQLGLGAMASSSSSSSAGGDNDAAKSLAPPAALDLFSSSKQSASRMSRPSLFPLPIRSYPSQSQYGHDRYRPTTAASGYMTPVPPFLPFARPLRSCSSDLLMRVVSPPPPRTEAAGLWLTLQAAPNQVREPILPQIPKSYLRIRDSNMKVEVVLKYLADKLGLTQSQQLELTCRGHLLPPFLLMKHVRDSIWCGSPAAMEDEAALSGIPPRRSPGDAVTTTDHVMTLFYSTARNH